MSIKTTALILASLGVLLVPMPTFAQAKAATDTSMSDAYVDFSIPDVPALGLFGVSPNAVSRPGNLKEFSLDVLPAAAGLDEIGSGVAFSWAPVYTFAHSVDSYRTGVWRRIAISGATTKDSKTSDVSVSVGGRFVLADRSDPLMDDGFQTAILRLLNASLSQSEQRNTFWNSRSMSRLLQAVARHMTTEPNTQAKLVDQFLSDWDITSSQASSAPEQVALFQKAINDVATSEGITALALTDDAGLSQEVEEAAAAFVDATHNLTKTPATIKSNLTKAHEDYLQAHWNALVLVADVGAFANSATGTWSDLAAQKIGGSLSAAFPTSPWSQVVLQVQSRKAIGTSPSEKSYYSAGGRVLLGNATKRLSVEGLVAHTNDNDASKNGQTKRATVGTELRVTDGFWLEVALGSEWGPSASGQVGGGLLSLANLKYAFNSKPRFSQIPGTDDSK